MENEISNNTSADVSLKKILLQFAEWYRYILSKTLVIIIISVLGGIAGYLYGWYKKPEYTAATTFVLQPGDGNGGSMGQYAGLASMVGVDIGGSGGGTGGIFQGDNLLVLYQSRQMIKRALLCEVEADGKKQLLIDRYIEINDLRKSWDKYPKLKDLTFNLKKGEVFSRLQDSLISAFANRLNADQLFVSKLDKKLSIIKVEVKSTDEQFAKLFNDKIVETVNDFYVQTKTKKSLTNLEILQHQTDSVKNVLNGAIYSSATVADATPNLNPTRQILRVSGQKSQFNAEANKAILTQLVQNLELSKISLRKETPLIQVIDTPVYPLNKNIFGKLRGLMIGCVLTGFLTILFLLIGKIYNTLMN